jgi:fatty acid amide hydrolase
VGREELTSCSATRLSELLGAGEVSSEEVTRAHLDRIEATAGRLHAFTEVLRVEAIAAARRADEERRCGAARGPLHGLPITLKESLDHAGSASTLGVERRRGAVAREDAVIVQMMRAAGAVILGRTNVSQLLLFHESRNPVFGQTANPWSLAHTPGGSSGGEAAAIASGCSPLGVGTDIGGSIRVPAHFSGIAGLKPTLDRWSNLGSNGVLVGQEAVRSQLGPMARTTGDLILAMGAIDPAAMSRLDGRVPPLAFPDPASVEIAKLRVGVLATDGLFAASRAVARAVRRARDALHAAGAHVVDVALPRVPEAIDAYFAALSADGGAASILALEGSEVDVALKSLVRLARLPRRALAVLATTLSTMGQRRVGRFLRVLGPKSVPELWRVTAELRAIRVGIERALREAGVDVLLCPAHATPALPHGASRDFVLAGEASILWNLTQLPAGVVPVTRVRADEAGREASRDQLERRAAEVDAVSAGLPVGVQVVGRAWEEHVVLAAMQAIEVDARNQPDFPLTPR